MKLTIPSFPNSTAIPMRYAFCKPAAQGHVSMSDNISPHIQWDDVPRGTRSLALIIVDPDVPSVGDDVNQEDRFVAHDLPRADFYHLVLINMPVKLREIPEGALSRGVTPRGKPAGKTDFGIQGINDYTAWFKGDPDMEGNYGGYDGPCPPWNDLRLHHYHFQLYALSIPELDLGGNFDGRQATKALEPHIISFAEWTGLYSLNPVVNNTI